MRWSLFLIAILWLTACTSALPISRTQGASPLASPPSTGTWTPGSLEGVVIVFERSGGLAGIHEVWRFYEDGRVIKTEPRRSVTKETQLPRGAVQEAVERVIKAGFLDLTNEYMPANRCCDRFTYRLTIVYKGSVKTVTTMDGAEQPPALARALEVVNALIDQITSKP